MLSLTNYHTVDTAVIKLIKYLSVNIDEATVIAELEKHPDYPSLLAISDVLTALKIENNASRIGFEELIDVPCPFIAHTWFDHSDFAVVTKIDTDSVIFSNGKWNNHKLSADEFKKYFAGVVLIAEPTAESVNHKSKANTQKIFSAPVAISVLFLILISGLLFNTNYISAITWQTSLLTVVKSVGVVISILLLVQSIDSNNPLVQVLCQGGGDKNCNAILSSKAAKVFEGLTWSEVGFFYFAGTWLLLLFSNHSVFVLQALAILNIISLPYTFYSIYYQTRVAKQWCVLCCTVQALLWLEFIPLITSFKTAFIAPT